MSKRLIYVHDPMCSWCWGFSDSYRSLIEHLPDSIEVVRLLGGLAADSDEAMPEPMKAMLQETWRRIEQVVPGKHFNFDFWRNCAPRRSTYPACRAVIAAREQGGEYDDLMTLQIQRAYYQQARNPSDNETLIELSAEMGLDAELFASQLVSSETQQQLVDEISLARSMGINGFPSLVLDIDGRLESILVNYTDVNSMLAQIDESLNRVNA